jgi:S-phase kinase-associated protein 1
MSEKEIVQMMNVANFLNIQPLLQITGAKLAYLCKLKTTAEIRELFGVESDFTPEEEEAIQKENEYLQKIHE